LFYAELNETMGLAQGEQFWQTVNSIPVTFCLQKQKRHWSIRRRHSEWL